MRRYGIAIATVTLAGAMLGLPSDTSAGTLTGSIIINDGAPTVVPGPVTVHVPASSTVPVDTVHLWMNGGDITGGPIAYTDSVEVTIGGSGVPFTFQAEWCDTDGACLTSEQATVISDDAPPAWAFVNVYDDPPAGTTTIGFVATDVSSIVAVQFSPDGTTWGEAVTPVGGPDRWQAPYPLFDPVHGGSPQLGKRTLHMRVQDGLGQWSPAQSKVIWAELRTTLVVSPPRPVSGQRVTLSVDSPDPVTIPAGAHCYWLIAWGDDQSLYGAEPDETYGFLYTYGPASRGFCGPKTFTMPWVPYPQMSASLQVLTKDDGDQVLEAGIGVERGQPVIVPVLDSTSRHITYSNMPMVYVLPDAYTLELGKPVTYRVYSVGGAPLAGGDWAADFAADSDDRFQHGGTSFTFTPKATGFVTVCWNSNTMKIPRYAACFDPPVRRRDTYRPSTTKPVARITPTVVVGSAVPVTVTWDGKDRGWGIAKYQLERRIDGGAWKRVLGRKTKTYTTLLAPGHRYQFRVRAIDRYGNVGHWDLGPSLRPALVEDGSAAIAYTGDWAAVADGTARGSTLHEASAASSKAVISFTGRDIAWLAERGPGHGIAKVYVDGAPAATVDLAAPSDAPAQVVFRRHWAGRGTHTLTIVASGTDGRPVVAVDGFAQLR
jgi:hypothetical protein